MKLKLAALMVLLGFSTLLGACQGADAPETDTPAAETEEAPATEEEPPAAE